MRKTRFAVPAVAALLLVWAASLHGQPPPDPTSPPPAAEASPPVPEKSWALELGADYSTRYLFRGVALLGDGGVLQPHARFGWGALSAYYYGYFGNVPAFKDRFAEADFGADYTFFLGEKASLTLGGVTYRYNNGAQRDLVFLDTYEAYCVLAFDGPLAPTVSYYHDLDKVKGGYLTLGISHGFILGRRVSLKLSGSAGFDFHYNNKDVSQGTLNDILIGADLPLQLTEALAAHVMLQQSFAMHALNDLVDTNPRSKAFNGSHTVLTAGLSYTF